MKNKKFGFTLAEVLITFAIIGVVAALTIPTLITNYQKKETVTKLQKAYAEIYQALRMSEAKYGDPEDWIKDSILFANRYLANTINITEICDSNNYNCWAETHDTLAGIEAKNASSYKTPSFLTVGGYAVKFWVGGSAEYKRHYQFIIDINGKKKPNIVGKDTFSYSYVREANGGWSLVPAGYYGSAYAKNNIIQRFTREEMLNNADLGCSHSVVSTAGSTLCAALIYEDGWQIKEDYPW